MNIERIDEIATSFAKGLAKWLAIVIGSFFLVTVAIGVGSDGTYGMFVSVAFILAMIFLGVWVISRQKNTQSVPTLKIYETDPLSLSPIEYEEYCAKLLKSAGWAVSTTKASGDQGADVVAELRGIRAVVQCKRYGSKVGNHAVQEAVAAKAHYSAHIAVVVCPLGYTRAANELAKSNRTILLGHNDLANLEKIAQIPLSPI